MTQEELVRYVEKELAKAADMINALVAERDEAQAALADLRAKLKTIAAGMHGLRWEPGVTIGGDNGLIVQWVNTLAALAQEPPR